MPLMRKLEEDEWDVLSIVTDPILLGEYLRNTADGSPIKEEWTTIPFKYRWYQKDLLTDKSEFISLIAGRAVGKCSTMWARVYIYPYGYMTINDILGFHAIHYKKGPTTIYAIDQETKELVQARYTVKPNGTHPVYRVVTSAGHIFEGTDNHPILTQRGYIMIQDLQEDDKAAIVTQLPHESMKAAFTWEELRWLGYVAGADKISPEMYLTLKFQKNVLEFQRIAEYFDAKLERAPNGQYRLLRKRGPLKHYVKMFLIEIRQRNALVDGFRRIHYAIKGESLEQNKIFLEAYYSAWGEFTTNTVHTTHTHKIFAYDLQEFLLRFGVESHVYFEQDKWHIDIDDYYSYWKFFEEFDIPGVSAKNLRLPPNKEHPFLRFDTIESIEYKKDEYTYAITVKDHENYISDNIFVHNSLVLEDKIIYDAMNVETSFPITKESLLVTANVAQLTPILDRLIMRLGGSFLLKDFLKGQINRSKGTLDFPQPGGSNYRINARIAGSKGESNMIGLHVPRIIGDEMSVFPMAAFTQLEPTFNAWEPNIQQFFCGVN